MSCNARLDWGMQNHAANKAWALAFDIAFSWLRRFQLTRVVLIWVITVK